MDLRQLKEDMAKCKGDGFAQDIGKVTPGVTVLSAPAFAVRERLVGCVILIGTFESSKVQEYGTKVALASRQISRKFGAQLNAIYPI